MRAGARARCGQRRHEANLRAASGLRAGIAARLRPEPPLATELSELANRARRTDASATGMRSRSIIPVGDASASPTGTEDAGWSDVPAGDPPGHRRDRIRRLLSARRSTHFDPPRPKGGNVGAAKCTQKSPAPPVPRPGGAGLGQYRNRDGRRCERGSHRRRVADGLRTRKHVICPYAGAAWTGNLGRFVCRIGRLALRALPWGFEPRTWVGGRHVSRTCGPVRRDPVRLGARRSVVHTRLFRVMVPISPQRPPRPRAVRRPDFLYVSHLHRDHFDPAFLARHVDKGARVLLPDFPAPFLAASSRPWASATSSRRVTASPSISTAWRSRSSR